MKPTTDSMQKPQLETSVEVKNDHSSPRWKKTAVIASSVLAALLVVAIIIGVITYVEVKKASDLNGVTVEATITYNVPRLNETIEEKVVVTDDEEDITTPKLRVIYDYKRGLLVTHLEADGNGRGMNICYVRRFTPQGNTSMIKAAVKAEERNVTVTSEPTTESYTSTGEPFDRNLLSERAAAMCKDSRVVLTVKDSEAAPGDAEGGLAIRKKRQEECGCDCDCFCGCDCDCPCECDCGYDYVIVKHPCDDDDADDDDDDDDDDPYCYTLYFYWLCWQCDCQK